MPPKQCRDMLEKAIDKWWARYDATYRSMAERGMRVLALAFKRTSATAEEAAAWPR